jgi:hypothetical protein
MAKPLATIRVLPMELQLGDRLSDETSEWEVVGRPYMTGGGKNAHARLQRVGDPLAHEVRIAHEVRSWSAYERITVSRAADEEGMKGKMSDT